MIAPKPAIMWRRSEDGDMAAPPEACRRVWNESRQLPVHCGLFRLLLEKILHSLPAWLAICDASVGNGVRAHRPPRHFVSHV